MINHDILFPIESHDLFHEFDRELLPRIAEMQKPPKRPAAIGALGP
jgi:hypothetical protein